MQLPKVVFVSLFLALLPECAYGAMTSMVNGYATTYTITDYSTSQKILFNGADAHVPNFRDYFALFAAGSVERLEWCYLDGSKVQIPTRLQTTGACTFYGLKPGNYAVRVYAAGGTALIDSVLFTVDPQGFEFRVVPQDGVVTIERTATTATVRRTGNFNVETIRVPAAVVFKQVQVNYNGQTTVTVIKPNPQTVVAPPPVKNRSVP